MILDYIYIPIYGIIAGVMSSILLGPIGVLCVQRTLSTSHRAGFISGLGAATADTIFAALAIFALSWITGFIDRYEIWVKVIGGILVVILGLVIFLKKTHRPKTIQSKGSYLSNYFSVLFVALPNPAYFFIFVAIFAAIGIEAADYNVAQKFLVVSGVFVGCAGWWMLLTWVVSKLRKKFTLHSLWWMNKISGGVIVLLGAYAIISVIYKLVAALIETGKV